MLTTRIPPSKAVEMIRACIIQRSFGAKMLTAAMGRMKNQKNQLVPNVRILDAVAYIPISDAAVAQIEYNRATPGTSR